MKTEAIKKFQLKTDLPEIKPGYIVRVYQKVKERDKDLSAARPPDEQDKQERLQLFEGLVIAVKHGKGINATFTVRKISDGIGVERIFPLHCPSIEKIEVIKKVKVRRAKLYYIRELSGKAARMKTIEMPSSTMPEAAAEENSPKEEKTTEIEKKKINN